MNKLIKLVLIFSILLLPTLSFAQDDLWYYMFPGYDGYEVVVSLVVLLLVLTAGLIGIVYAIAGFLDNDSIKVWCKLELFEIAYSALLFSFIISIFPIADGIFTSSAGSLFEQDTVQVVNALAISDDSYNMIPTHFRYSKWFLSSLFNEAVLYNKEVMSSYAFTALLGDIYVSLDLFWEQRGFINYNPIKGFVHMENIVKMQVFDFVAKVSLITKIQEILLHLVASAIFPLFLASGVILRAFPITRRLGGLLMAIAFALYFIFPLAYIFAGSVYDHVGGVGSLTIDMSQAQGLVNPFHGLYKDDPAELGIDKPFDFQEFEESGGDLNDIPDILKEKSNLDICALLEKNSDPQFDPDNPIQDPDADAVLGSVGDWANRFTESGMNVGGVDDGYFDIPARFIFFSMFFSFFGLMMTVAGIRSLSQTFGGDLEIAGLTHLI